MINFFFHQFLLTLIFLTLFFSHIAKKNLAVVIAYSVQSFALVIILFGSFLTTKALPLLFIVLFTFCVKVILGPLFFITLIHKHKWTFSVNNNLNLPLTLTVIFILTAFAHSKRFIPLTNIISPDNTLLPLAFATMFLSLFLIINRKGAFSQIIGILSFENSIVAFAIFAGLEQSVAFQMGILFNILIWLSITTVFVSLIYKHFGSLDVTFMKYLKD